MSDNAAEMSKRAVKDWFSNEGIKVESISNPRANYLFKIKWVVEKASDILPKKEK